MLPYLSSAALLIAAATASSPLELVERATCIACNPSGWKTTNTPAIGPDMAPMYANLINSVVNIRWKRNALPEVPAQLNSKRDTPPICCADTTQCVLMVNMLIPFCYDKFTTNFFLPDGTLGNMASGIYNTSTPGKSINLITGDVSGPGGGSNLYANDPSTKPNTSILPIPPVYTAAGVGSAIPIASLGVGGLGSGGADAATARAKGPTTISAVTVAPSVVAEFTGSDGKVTPASTMLGTTIPAITIKGTASATASNAAGKVRLDGDAGFVGVLGVAVMGVVGGMALIL